MHLWKARGRRPRPALSPVARGVVAALAMVALLQALLDQSPG
jgi:hypothetical protein